MNRRGFLAGLGAMLAAPAVVHAGNLMPVRSIQRFRLFELPTLVGDGVHDDTAALQAALDGEPYVDVTAGGALVFRVSLRGAAEPLLLRSGVYRISRELRPPSAASRIWATA